MGEVNRMIRLVLYVAGKCYRKGNLRCYFVLQKDRKNTTKTKE